MRDGGLLDTRGLGLAPGLGAGGPASFDALGFRGAFSGDGRSALRAGLAWVDGFVPASRRQNEAARPLSLRRQRPSRGRPADGGAVGQDRGGGYPFGPRFDQSVPPGGYAWWYVDALSADGKHSLTLIGFVGSVFSPYYRLAGRKRPEDHVSINVALTGPAGKRWTMTERRRDALHRDAGTLLVGPSAMRWDGTGLTVSIDEISPLIPRRVKGTIRLYPEAVVNHPVALDADQRHCWWPIAPCARVEVELDHPALSWSGSGYFDFNTGEVPLEESFHRWNWCRASVPEGTVVLYDLLDRDDQSCSLAIRFDPKTGVADFEAPPPARLKKSFWGMRRSTRAERGVEAKVLETLEDSPFYTRSVVGTRLLGRDVTAIHESVDLDRFANPLVQMMLPYRMPRRFV